MSNITRRDFLKGATAGAIGVASLGMFGASAMAEEAAVETAEVIVPVATYEADICIVGAGVSGLAATVQAAELGMGLFYRYVLRVDFWDYSDQAFNLRGLVCLRFSLYWSGLALVLVYVADSPILRVIQVIPPWLDVPAVMVLALDGAVSAFALRMTGNTEVLRWYR